ncbi:hypothetical protein Q5752_005256 [Cryptotrichosporon argae]
MTSTAVTRPSTSTRTRATSPSRSDSSGSLTVSSTSTSAGAAVTRSVLLFMGIMFRRPSKLFRPNRVDTWGALRHLANSADQTLSPAFIRTILRAKGGALALAAAVVPPLLINTTLGFLLFTSHSLFSLGLARFPFFQRHVHHPHPSGDALTLDGDDVDAEPDGDPHEDAITLETLVRGPTVVPRHPTLLSALAGAGAGLVQGAAFTPIENVVRLLQQSATSLTTLAARILRLPLPTLAPALAAAQQGAPANPIEAIRTFLASDSWRRSRSWWTGWRWAVGRDAASYAVFFAAFDVTRRLGLRVKALMGGPVLMEWDNFVSLDLRAAAAPAPVPARTHTHPSVLASLRQSAAGEHPDETPTPTAARVAQAVTIVGGGITAGVLAGLVGRPFRACQRIMQQAHAQAQAQAQALAEIPAAGPRASPAAIGSAATTPPVPRAAAVAPRAHGWAPIVRVYRAHGLGPFVSPDAPAPPPAAQSDTAPALRRIASRVGWRIAAVGPWGLGFLVWAWVGGEI